MSSEEQVQEGASAPVVEEREMVVTVTMRYPVQLIISSYADAISPDGGFTGTPNEWIEDHARGFIAEMTGQDSHGVYEGSWKLVSPDQCWCHWPNEDCDLRANGVLPAQCNCPAYPTSAIAPEALPESQSSMLGDAQSASYGGAS